MQPRLERRTVLKLMAGAAAAASVAGSDWATAQAVKWSSGAEPPKLRAPANAADCHHHIYDARYPADPKAALRPPDALVEDYRALQRRIGTSRNVIVTPSTYDTDNRVTLDALAAFGAQARAVAVVNDRVVDSELKRMDALGVRGIAGGDSTILMRWLEVGVGQIGRVDMQVNSIGRSADLAAIPLAFSRASRSSACLKN
jgi:D-galactarolactone isomerase